MSIEKKATVSVIIPVYNSATYMQPCVESVLVQSYKNLEVILINDGSSDATEQICQSYMFRDKRVRVITKKNEGAGAARNTGIDAANGEYIFFVDSDDSLAKEAIELMVEEIEKGFDVVQCKSVMVYEGNQQDDKSWPSERIELNKLDAMKNYLYEAKPIIRYSVWAKLIRKNAIGNLRFMNLKIREDVVFNAGLINNCSKMVYIPQTLYFTTIRENSLSRSTWDEQKMQAVLSCNDEIIYLLESKEEYRFLLPRAWWVKVLTLIELSKTIYRDKTENWENQWKELQEIGLKWSVPAHMLNKTQKCIYFLYKKWPKGFVWIMYKLGK